VEEAGKLALQGQVEAVVTAPVSKEAIARSGVPFQGHTEFLARMAGVRDFVMMLAGERLRVALVTTHLALGEVSGLLKEEKILSVIRITARSLRDYFGFPAPRIAVTAFNPHAGEGGLFGREEAIISRAVKRARKQGWDVSGPWPADSLFHRAARGEYQAVVCMYHDQGLIPLKLLHFDSAVNVTLGLPFIRTSVDHGTAFDIAGRGLASSRSMEEAIKLAARMALRRRSAASWDTDKHRFYGQRPKDKDQLGRG
jgi:4-hydroxythreonine-4-phosphate dehydrogenase